MPLGVSMCLGSVQGRRAIGFNQRLDDDFRLLVVASGSFGRYPKFQIGTGQRPLSPLHGRAYGTLAMAMVESVLSIPSAVTEVTE